MDHIFCKIVLVQLYMIKSYDFFYILLHTLSVCTIYNKTMLQKLIQSFFVRNLICTFFCNKWSFLRSCTKLLLCIFWNWDFARTSLDVLNSYGSGSGGIHWSPTPVTPNVLSWYSGKPCTAKRISNSAWCPPAQIAFWKIYARIRLIMWFVLRWLSIFRLRGTVELKRIFGLPFVTSQFQRGMSMVEDTCCFHCSWSPEEEETELQSLYNNDASWAGVWNICPKPGDCCSRGPECKGMQRHPCYTCFAMRRKLKESKISPTLGSLVLDFWQPSRLF